MPDLRKSITHGGIAVLSLLGVSIAAPQAANVGDTPGAGVSDADSGTFLSSVFDFPAVDTAGQQQQNPMSQTSRYEARKQLSAIGLEARAGNASVEKYNELNQAYERTYPGAPEHTSKCSPGEPCRENSVDLEQVGQETDWWCGPAVAYMMIDQLARDGTIDGTDSTAGGDLSQSALADDDYTDSERGGTYRVDMRKALNKWTGEKFYRVMNNPSVKEFRASLLENIDRGQSIAVAALEPAGGPHYNGHPTSMTVDHWIAAKGYEDGGLTTEFADPSTTIWSSASPTFSHNTKDFVRNFVEPQKAIVW